MAYSANELFATQPGNSFDRVIPKLVQAKTLGPIGGAPTLQPLTPLAFNTSSGKWVVWTNGGANGTGTIAGFLYPDVAVADAANDTIVQVLMRGVVHHDDIPLPTGETQNNLDAALKSGPRLVGLDIQGLAGSH